MSDRTLFASTLIASTLVSVFVLGAPGATSAHAATDGGSVQTCDGTFHRVRIPFRDSLDNYLFGVDALSPTDVWAVGESNGTYAIHWDGSRWSITPTPSPSPYSYFSGVAAVASNDVWAVGAWQSRPGFPWSPMIEHWDGASWTRTPIPDLPGGTVLASVSGVAPDDVWAVGTMDPEYPLTMHWDGSSWAVVGNPLGSTFADLRGVHALGTDDVWAVGALGQNGYDSPLAMHWDGSAWHVSPLPSTIAAALESVSGLSSNDVWAVGLADTQLVLHWDGFSWHPVDTPWSLQGNVFFAVDELSLDDVLAGGYYATSPYQKAFIAEGTGGSWFAVPDYPGAGRSFVYGLTSAANWRWAVGFDDASKHVPVVQQACEAS